MFLLSGTNRQRCYISTIAHVPQHTEATLQRTENMPETQGSAAAAPKKEWKGRRKLLANKLPTLKDINLRKRPPNDGRRAAREAKLQKSRRLVRIVTAPPKPPRNNKPMRHITVAKQPPKKRMPTDEEQVQMQALIDEADPEQLGLALENDKLWFRPMTKQEQDAAFEAMQTQEKQLSLE